MRRRRWALALGITLLGGLLGVVLAPGLIARPYAIARLEAALGSRVRLGWIAWNPFTGSWTVSRLHVAAKSGPAAIIVRRARARVHVIEALLGHYRVRSLELDGARVRLRAEPSGWALPLPTATEHAAPAELPPVRVDWLEAPHAVVRLEPRPTMRSMLRARRLQASAIVGPGEMRATVWTRGRLDRGSVALVGKLRSARDDRRIRVRLSAVGLDLTRTLRLAPETPVADLRGLLDLRARYDESGAGRSLERRASGRLAARDFALRAHGVDGVWIRTLRVSRFDADLQARHIRLAAVDLGRPELWVRRSGAEVTIPGVLDVGAEPMTGGLGWQFSIGHVVLEDGLVHHIDAASGRQVLDVAVSHATTGAWRTPADPVSFAMTASLGSGGTLSADGELVRNPLSGTVTLDVADVDLPPLLALTPTPVALESGRASGRFELGIGSGAATGSGTLALRDVKTRSPDPAHPEDVAAFRELRAEVREVRSDPRLIALDRLEIDWPYLLVDRFSESIFPLSLLSQAAAGSEGMPPMQVRIEGLAVMGGRLDFRDSTLTPPYWRSLANLRLAADRSMTPSFRVGHLQMTGLVDEISPLRVEGTIGSVTHLAADVERLALPPFNAYLADAAPYTVSSGILSGHSEIHLERSELEVNNRVVFSRLGLGGAGRNDFVQREVGIPLTLALALMKDYRGNIELSLPFGGNLREPTFSMRDIVLQAIVRAVRGAILSPLTALGRVFLRDGRIERFDLEPIPFEPGSATLDASSRARMDQVTRVIQSRPDLALRVRGQVASADVERFQDEAVLNTLVQTRGSERLRAFLETRIAGGPAQPLRAEDEATVAELRGSVGWPGERLADLAVQRGAVAAAAFIVDYGLAPEAVRAVEPEPVAPERLAPAPAGAVELVERTDRWPRLRPSGRGE